MNKKKIKLIKYNLIAVLSICSLSAGALDMAIDSPDIYFEYVATDHNMDTIAPASEVPLVLSTRHPDSANRSKIENGAVSLASRLAEKLGITRAQGAAGAGSIFRYAKLKLSAEEFRIIHAKVPDMDRLLIAGPNARVPDNLVNGDAEDLEFAALLLKDDFDQFGLASDMLEKFIPLVVEYVESQADKPTARLLQNALQGI